MTQAEHKGVSADRLASEMFAPLLQAYLECSDEVQAAIRDMVQVINSEDVTEDEREAALSTVAEALFPSRHKGELGVDLEHCETAPPGEIQKLLERMNAEEASFAEKLQAVMEAREMTQIDLAKAIGVGQSAVSMMLSRECRPQRRTVEKIATALTVSVEDLWPGMKQD